MEETKKEEVKPSILSHILVEEMIPNPQNPRMLFDPEPLKLLEKSIKHAGILNPLLVYKKEKGGKIVILDGERRWRCAKNLGMKTVPANIIQEPTPLENIIKMFNIHNIREDWDLMPTALKLEVIIRSTKIKFNKELSAMTSLSVSTVERCKKLLSFPKKYQDLMIVAEPKDRVKTDFFIEMHQVLNLIEKNLFKVEKKFKRDGITDLLLEKYNKGIFTNVVHFRKIADLIRSIKKGVPKKDVEDKVMYFLNNKEATLKDILESSDDISAKLNLRKTFDKLSEKLNKTPIKNIDYDSLISLKEVIDKKLKEIKKYKGD